MNDDPETRMRLIFSLRSHGVTDPRALEAIERTPREAFLDRSFRPCRLGNMG